MQKVLYGVGTVAVLALIFTLGIRVGSHPQAASINAPVVKTNEASIGIPVFDIMVKRGKNLPVQPVSDLF
jgi:hypothetical protein